MNAITTPSGADLKANLDRINAPSTIRRESAAASLDSEDFLRLMTAQLANQDPLEPQSNEQMLAQLAQFSNLENGTASRATLDEISAKLDALIEAQERAAAAAASAAEAAAFANQIAT
ncbi:Flagellar hook capping protein [Erythrobacter sp. NAP1]|uniref:flagellar hook assembly protein FlgD n=1 Tax=Erythrobacter sp. NAP1 TaxID=237727 RepID=UPI00006878A9|nr:flagellar hook capping FlgD N-terminal domain-containing protein [Erythrobacter sp. NAP1]EAQ28877.1 Flagellar hook capping protein [Erythrobacter sp. NAP1]